MWLLLATLLGWADRAVLERYRQVTIAPTVRTPDSVYLPQLFQTLTS